MRYDEVMAVLSSMRTSEWSRVEDFYPEPHSDLAVHRTEVGLSLAWGAKIRGGDTYERQKWAETFADSKVTGLFADVRWNGQPVIRRALLYVDGGRAIVPSGVELTDESGQVVGLRVQSEELAIARIVHAMTNGTDLDSVLDRLRIEYG